MEELAHGLIHLIQADGIILKFTPDEENHISKPHFSIYIKFTLFIIYISPR